MISVSYLLPYFYLSFNSVITFENTNETVTSQPFFVSIFSLAVLKVFWIYLKCYYYRKMIKLNNLNSGLYVVFEKNKVVNKTRTTHE